LSKELTEDQELLPDVTLAAEPSEGGLTIGVLLGGVFTSGVSFTSGCAEH